MSQDTTEARFERLEASHFRTGEDLASIKGDVSALRVSIDANHSKTLEEFGIVHAEYDTLREQLNVIDGRVDDVSTRLLQLEQISNTRHTAIMEALNTLLGRQ
ncbi:hypothetical protein ACFU44_00505 [Nocardia rhizosphaerihabitans]|uniref:hypothetical protein n=1 Tax=Nocardia rhizosphaerihabitans TaxID=1691570 RepID=UPI003672DB8C